MNVFSSPGRRAGQVANLDELQALAAERAKITALPTPPPAVVPLPAPAAPVVPGLADAQAEAMRLSELAASAAALVRTAAERVAETVKAKERLGDLAAKAVEIGTSKIKSGDLSPLPADLVEARRSAFDCDLDARDALAVLAVLEAEAGVAQSVADAGHAVLVLAADRAMQTTALEMVSRIRTLEQEAGKLRGLVSGLSLARLPTDPRLSWEIERLLHAPQHAPLVDGGAGPNWASAGRSWSAFKAALMLDVGAVFKG